jgi:carboxyl-terminal processing protease
MMRGRTLPVVGILAFVASLLLGWSLMTPGHGARDDIYYDLTLFSEVLSNVKTKYVEQIDSHRLIGAAIAGMLDELDPHTQFLDPDEYKELQIGTEGSFGGLGITIGIRDEVLTVISPIEGTPAYSMGIQPGDEIIEIERVSTTGLSLREAVQQLRGPAGTQVTITIRREGITEPFEITITRATINIESVPYSAMVSPGVGYVRLATFSRQSNEELQEAIRDLESRGARGIILDLRNNSGGVLRGAVDVSDNFLPKGSLIVSTKGRTRESNQEFRARSETDHGDLLVAVLVNGGSASASEIVAGAIQDWDRGIILGTETFGKGSVQSVIPLSHDSALKLTTAKYYTPSGRCIDTNGHEPEEMAETTAEGESPAIDSTEVYHTIGGLERTVYGGGGINPDVTVEFPDFPLIVQDFLRWSAFFEFAVKYTAAHPDIERDFAVDQAMLDDFRAFLEEKGHDFDESDFGENVDLIRGEIERYIASDLWGTQGWYDAALDDDVQVQSAIELLSKAEDTHHLLALAQAENEGEARIVSGRGGS